MSDQTGAPSQGRTTTTDHDVIRRWAEDRHATPATSPGTEADGQVEVLRLDMEFGQEFEVLKHVTWDEWFEAFDRLGLQFTFDETPRPDGSRSNDFHIGPAGEAV